ncbi:hypothetical protein FOZ63_009349, partial [Perkinsus olseni]
VQFMCGNGSEAAVASADEECRDSGKYRGVMVVVGSEAHGRSAELLECCTRVTLPMSMAADSLNASIAGGVLLYDIVLRLQEGKASANSMFLISFYSCWVQLLDGLVTEIIFCRADQ